MILTVTVIFRTDIGQYYHTNLISKSMQSVVKLELKYINEKGEESGGHGTGFYISENQILTNYHVVQYAVEKGSKINVINSNGLEFEGTVGHFSKVSDLAVVDIPKNQKPGIPLKFCRNVDDLPLGTRVNTLGHPLGFDFMASEGIISRNVFRSSGSYPYYIVTDNKVYQGNSGGPMILQNGCAAGVSAMLYNKEGQIYSLSISAGYIESIYDRMLNGTLDFPLLGINMDEDLTIKAVSLVSELYKSGILAGDRIVEINNIKVTKRNFFDKLLNIRKGDIYNLSVMRNQEKLIFSLKSENRIK